METKTKTIAEYKAPKCKCVEVHLEKQVLQVTSPTGEDFNESQNLGGSWIDDDE